MRLRLTNNDYRDLRKIERFLSRINSLGSEGIAALGATPAQLMELEAAANDANALLASRTWDDAQRVRVEKRLNAIVYELEIDPGAAVPPKKQAAAERATDFFANFSDFLTNIYGSRDFYTWRRLY